MRRRWTAGHARQNGHERNPTHNDRRNYRYLSALDRVGDARSHYRNTFWSNAFSVQIERYLR